jgi:phosphoglycolate phosphatase
MNKLHTTPKAILFDLDGTLANTIKDITFAINAALESISLEPINEVQGKSFVGRGLKNALVNALEARGKRVSDQQLDKLMAILSKNYESHPVQFATAYEGAQEFLELCQSKQIIVGVLSNKDHALVVTIVKHLFPTITFAFVQGALSEYPLKPDPKTVHLFMEEHNLDSDELLFIGDSEVDDLTSQRANVRGALVSWGFRDKKELEYSNFSPIYDTFEQLRKGELYL